MKTFVISLQRSDDRRAGVHAQFTRLRMPYRFFDAVEGNANASRHFLRFDRRLYRLNTYRDPRPGEIACYASHLELWKYSARTNEAIVVLEDDCQLEPDFPAAMQAVERLIDRFGFIRLQSPTRHRRLRVGQSAHRLLDTGAFELYYLARVPLCLTGYAIAPQTAAKLAAASTTLTAPVDKFAQRTWEHGAPMYGLEPASVTLSPLADTSTIGDRSVRQRGARDMLARARYKLGCTIRRSRFNRSQLARLSDEATDGAAAPLPNPPARPGRHCVSQES